MLTSHSDFSSETDIDEAAPVFLPPGVAKILHGYLGNEINLNWAGDEKTQQFSEKERQQFRLFDRNFYQELATQAATLILRGEESDVKNVLALIAKNPGLLRYQTTAKDPLGRTVKGTPLQIAAMAGDVNLKEDIVEEKELGLVERLIKTGNLSKEEVFEQLKVITSDESKQENAKRSKRVLDAVLQFANGLIEKKDDRQALANQLEMDLKQVANEEITSGYIFDPAVFFDLITWLWITTRNFERLGDQGDFFAINAFGKLQTQLSSRDAQVVLAGIGKLTQDDIVPSRTLVKDKKTYFYNDKSLLGIDFYLGYFRPDVGRPYQAGEISMAGFDGGTCWEELVRRKEYVFKTFVKPSEIKSEPETVVDVVPSWCSIS